MACSIEIKKMAMTILYLNTVVHKFLGRFVESCFIRFMKSRKKRPNILSIAEQAIGYETLFFQCMIASKQQCADYAAVKSSFDLKEQKV